MEFFLCCPPEMMAVMERNLKELGVGPDQIHSERFWL
jgi:ferredoxin-NADP reductase